MEQDNITQDHQEYRRFVQESYTPLHPHLFTLKNDMLTPTLVDAITDGRQESLMAVLREEHPQVYSFNMLQKEFCEQLLEESTWFEKWCQEMKVEKKVPNGMNNYGVILDDFGFWPFLQETMQKVVSPFASILYPDVGGDSLDAHHGFIVEYAIGKDTELSFHVDASDVTLNICLGKKFTGGSLYFGGIRCFECMDTTPPLAHEEIEIEHFQGRALLHRGKNRHSARPIEDGERYNLIL